MSAAKPRIVVFFGGDDIGRDLSEQTGYWVCQHIPRDKYEVSPVHVLSNGLWQVPSGSLPQRGKVDRMLFHLFSGLSKLSPKDGLQRLLQRPVSALMSVVRGRGGDDGATQGLGQSLDIPVVGASLATCQQTSNKRIYANAVEDLAQVPEMLFFSETAPLEEMIEVVRREMVPPVFIKPVNQEGSAGTELVNEFEALAGALRRASIFGDVIVQEKAHGTEISISLVPDARGQIRMLPPTVIVPHKSQYYDYYGKRRPGRAALHTRDHKDNALMWEAELIARDVYDRLGCNGFASVDIVADDSSIDVLEVNTVPVANEVNPLVQQLAAANLAPETFLDDWISGSLER